MESVLCYSGQLTVTTCWCGIRHAVPQELYDLQKRQKRDGTSQTSIYCPLGHEWISGGEGEAARLRKELESKQRALEAKDRALQFQTAEVSRLEKSNKAQRAATTRIKNRIAKAVCPVPGCKRCFKPGQMQAHLKTVHRDFVKEN